MSHWNIPAEVVKYEERISALLQRAEKAEAACAEMKLELEQLSMEWHKDRKHGGLYYGWDFELCMRTKNLICNSGTTLLAEIASLRDKALRALPDEGGKDEK